VIKCRTPAAVTSDKALCTPIHIEKCSGEKSSASLNGKAKNKISKPDGKEIPTPW